MPRSWAICPKTPEIHGDRRLSRIYYDANLSSSALGGTNREYLIRDTDPQDIQPYKPLSR